MRTHVTSARRARMLLGGGLAFAVAAGLTIPGTAIAAPTTADESTAIVSADRATEGEVMNYAINLAPSATDDQIATARAAVEKLGGVNLANYPEIRSFFAQSSSATFAGDLNNALAGVGVPVISIGPTRVAPVTGAEIVVPVTAEVAEATAAAVRSGATAVESQLDDDPAAQPVFAPDPLTEYAWGVQAIGALEAQQVDAVSEKVVVGILDTGIEGDHEDLADQIDQSLSVGCSVNGIADNSYDAWQDDHYHGTHVAGTVAAAHNGIGVDGVAPKATLAAVKTSNAAGLFYPEYVTCGMDWAADHGFDVTNNSYYVDPWAYWIPTEPSQAAGYEVVRRAFDRANDEGVVNVVAAGNESVDIDNPTVDSDSPNDVDDQILNRDVSNGFNIPTMLDSVVSVSAVAMPRDSDDALTAVLSRSTFSNYGANRVELAAPGTDIASTFNSKYNGRTKYTYLSGTSMASPHVAGVMALLRSMHPDASVEDIKQLAYKQAGYLYNRLAEPTDGAEYRGHGLTNALDAVLKDQDKPVVSAPELSFNGGETWIAGDTPVTLPAEAETVIIRVTVSGAYRSATLAAGNSAEVTLTGDGHGTEPAVLTSSEIGVAGFAKDGVFELPYTVKATGRVNDDRADDDVELSGLIEGTIKQPEPEPEEKPDPEVKPDPDQQSGGSATDPEVKPAEGAAKGGASALAATGAQVAGVLGGAALLLAAGAGLMVARRRS